MPRDAEFGISAVFELRSPNVAGATQKGPTQATNHHEQEYVHGSVCGSIQSIKNQPIVAFLFALRFEASSPDRTNYFDRTSILMKMSDAMPA